MTGTGFRHQAIKVGDGLDCDMSGQKIIGLAAPTSNGDALRYENLSGIPKTASGNYTGNSSVNKAIAHSLGFTPKIVLITSTVDGDNNMFEIHSSVIGTLDGASTSVFAVTAKDATNFYVGNAGSYSKSANLNLRIYYWVAIS